MSFFISRSAAALFLVLLLSAFSEDAAAQTQTIAVDDDNGYAGRVMEKVMGKWSPPSVIGTHTVLVKLLLDGSGAVMSCTPLRKSSLDAFDNVACSAIRKAAPFGRTSYEAPLTLYLSFRIGTEDSKERMSDMEKLRAELREKNRLENERASKDADAALKRSRERAQVTANERGEPLPRVQAAPIARPASSEKSDAKQKNAPAKQAGPAEKSAKKGPVLHSYGEDMNSRESRGRDSGTLSVVSTKTEERVQKYTDLLHDSLDRVLWIPKNAQHNSYSLRMRLSVDSAGRISNVHVEQSSGDPSVDNALVRCVIQARTVPAPPKGIGQTFSVPLTATRRASK